MAAYNKFEQFVGDLSRGVHQFHAAGHQLEVYLSNTAPNAATHAVKADLAEITNENGYTAPIDTQNDESDSGGTSTITAGANSVVTASGGTVGPFRYVVLFNQTPASPLDPLIAWWDYGSNLTLQDGESFTVQYGASLFTIA